MEHMVCETAIITATTGRRKIRDAKWLIFQPFLVLHAMRGEARPEREKTVMSDMTVMQHTHKVKEFSKTT